MACSRQEPPKCITVGKPVNPILGCKILTEEPDLFVDAHLPLILRRTYASDEPYEGLLGQGWSFDLGYRMEILSDEIHLYDAHGSKCRFPRLEVGSSHLEANGRRTLVFSQKNRYIYHIAGRYYHFVSSEDSEGLFRLTSIKDDNDNAIQFFYEGAKRFASFIALDNQRLFRLIGNEQRLLGVEEVVWDKTNLSKHLLALKDDLLLLQYAQKEEHLRLSSVETFVYDEKTKEKLLETHALDETLEGTIKPMVHYSFSKENDLIAVYGKDDVLLRTFTYTNHVMTSHKVPEGLESYYEYDEYSATGKVLKNHTNTGQVWHFEYEEEQTIVTDALGREMVYRFDSDHYLTSKLNALHQESTLRYTPNGQLKEIVDVTGKSQHFDFNDEGLLVATRAGMFNQISYRYHLKHKKPIVKEVRGAKTLFRYDSRGNLSQTTLPHKQTITYKRDLYGNPIEISDAFGTSYLSYNASGNIIKYINVEGE
ncbi:MAG: DUF6531 domain-containing protein, partial [Sulfurovum sp.]|nr:DUF6531 domain-containing protein [Sulfurovum sp.]